MGFTEHGRAIVGFQVLTSSNYEFPVIWKPPERVVVDHYNNVRLNSATGYVTPKDMLAGRQQEIHAERDRKLEAARKQRQFRRQQAT